ncbi:MAG: hypothetical protein IH624_12830 [Phycisphaerae bacterium]|nr:hypothetical protein [Phycisphaerae bacterium]
MAKPVNRRTFLSGSIAASTAAALALSLEEKALLAQGDTVEAAAVPAEKGPMGKIGSVEISRLICGGNLLNGYAHARDLIYVSELLRRYFTDEKIMETWQLCESAGINTMISTCDCPYSGGKDPTVRLLNRYRNEHRGRMQWIAQCQPQGKGMTDSMQRAIDNGACGVFLQGEVGDRFVRENRLDLIEKIVTWIKDKGVLAGVAGHSVDVPIAVETAGMPVDFHMKTLHHHNYWSAMPAEQKLEVSANHNDNYYCRTPEQTIEFMKEVKTPWIAYKVLAAGAIRPQSGFDYAFKNGADFACVGMFDFQVKEDQSVAKDVVARYKNRTRPWRA